MQTVYAPLTICYGFDVGVGLNFVMLLNSNWYNILANIKVIHVLFLGIHVSINMINF